MNEITWVSPDKAAFFADMDRQHLSLTFDDVRLQAGFTEVDPPNVSLESQFTENVGLKVPFVSAAMDTVTTAPMAIAMAKAGGIGVIHAGLSVEAQRDEVRHVKLALNGLIESPISFTVDQSVESTLQHCADNSYDFHSFPILDTDGKFAGLLTKDNIKFCTDLSTPVGEAMTPTDHVATAGTDTGIETAYDLMKPGQHNQMVLLTTDGQVAGMYVWSDVRRIIDDNSGPFNVDTNGRLRVAAAVPTSEQALLRAEAMRKYVDVLVIDTAKGNSQRTIDTIHSLKEAFGDIDIVAGNVSTADAARRLAEAGANAVKVGQGGGSICTTRVVTGIGTPQLSAVYNSVRAIRRSRRPDVPVISDGGVRDPGDVSLAIAAGASSVMFGNMLAGTDMTPGEIIEIDGKEYKIYRGMGSEKALKTSAASRDRYGANGSRPPAAEGVEAYVDYKGPVAKVLVRLEQSLRQSMSYVGAVSIAAHQNDSSFTRITNAGMAESRPHNVVIVQA